MNELALAACENPRQPHESDDDYANRIYEASLYKARTAATFGKALHAAVEIYPQIPLDQELLPWFFKLESWWTANNIEPIQREARLVDHDIGVAGTTDLICLYNGRRAIVDYKTQNVKTDSKTGKKKPAFYDSWPRQLSFYGVADAKVNGAFPEIPEHISLVIDSNEGGEIYEKVWDKAEILSAYEDFVLATWCWQKKKKYWPAGAWTITQNIPMPMPQSWKA